VNPFQFVQRWSAAVPQLRDDLPAAASRSNQPARAPARRIGRRGDRAR
jgi:hypothetical protein